MTRLPHTITTLATLAALQGFGVVYLGGRDAWIPAGFLAVGALITIELCLLAERAHRARQRACCGLWAHSRGLVHGADCPRLPDLTSRDLVLVTPPCPRCHQQDDCDHRRAA